ncbi:LysR family transcriptional regulator [Brevibacillus borstelensis]|uniref:LysR family transcriptional regulator n=1 Tax=Brevibacillus borstelensis TaxID=45462 RepID=UPI00046A120E|nr:LysR family transcriptional regulator [Brevibacillus borstelensis]MCM3620735.1 LysR family transcriptional regulator [Brevibacillus borstelensis]MED1851158.1 LysR family transcriptional regulator [Brevibacillus borstelensis]MED1875031.1 LysR family transcriptional regulator [Brevibacillus borstelensis]
MDLDSLEIFLAIARHGSLNRAAHALFLAQSTVTHRLKQLERQVGTPLFTRTSTGVSLTAEGRRLLPVAATVVEQLRAFSTHREERQSLTVVAGKAFASYELPRLLGQYRKEHPHFTCYVRSTLYEESISSLLTGTADIAFLGHEVYHPHIHQEFLPNDRVMLVTSPEHPWADTFPGFGRWGSEPVIAFGSQSAPFRQRVDRFLAQHGVFPNVIMELDSFSAVIKMVQQQLGVTMLPERTVQDEVRAGRLAALDISHGEFTRPTLIAYLHAKKEDEAFMPFVQWIKQVY